MTNRLYPFWKEGMMKGTALFDVDNDTAADGVFAVLVDTTPGGYTYSDTHQFYSGTISSFIVNVEQRIVTPTIGVVGASIFDGNDLVYVSVTGNSVEAIVLFRKNPGANTTWPLVMYYDTGGTGLPVNPNGGNVTVAWNANGIFQL